MDDFAMRLRFAIERSGMQQKKLATALKLSPARLSNYVNGHSEPSLDVLLLICKELKVSADYMIGLTDNINGSTEFALLRLHALSKKCRHRRRQKDCLVLPFLILCV